ncbi:hypothetical protein [Aggregatibacter actinomycetemcomitans]|uniref:hypothetical protein n=2 Tax=Aggregatibacter actinomycetemcomitans TaxID=714 RepID=UPI0021508083|nr:hypothetical protein [Aggregatibacter actinomycetemcomitans]
MKPTNPMAKLEQWKKNNEQEKINQFVNEMNQTQIGAVKNCETDRQFAKAQKANLHSDQKTQQEAQSGEKRKYQGKLSFNPLAFEYAQLSRQFKLIHDSNRKCLEVYPDDFHHKLKMRGECVDLVERLKGGGKLFNDLAKGTNLTQEQTALLKAFNQVNGYLIYKFSEVAEQIDQLNIERVEEQKTTDSKMN